MKLLSYSVVEGVEFDDSAIINASESKLSAWGSRRSNVTIELRLSALAVLAEVAFFNLGTKSAAVEVAPDDKGCPGKRRYLQVGANARLPRNRRASLRGGFLPCRFVRLTLCEGSPVSLRSLRLRGVPAADIDHRVGPAGTSLLVHRPTHFIFGPSMGLARRRPRTSPQKAARLAAPAGMQRVLKHLEGRETVWDMRERELAWWRRHIDIV